jgi:hypothetical protein
MVPNVQAVPAVQTPFFIPRDAGDKRGGGLNRAQRLNGWNVWNGVFYGS